MSVQLPDDLADMRLLNDVAASELLAVSPWFLRRERIHGRGPQFVRIGRGSGRIRYRVADLLDYIARSTVDPQD